MDKLEFLSELREALRGLPEADVEERLSFYSEMIDDRMEEGATLEEAMREIGSVRDIRAEIIRTTPLVKIIAEKVKPLRKVKVWEIVLVVLGAPIWVSLLTAVFSVLLSLYAVAWSVTAALWAVELALAVCAPCGVVGFFIYSALGNMPAALLVLGVGLLSGGLAICAFFGCKELTRAIILLTKKTVIGIKNLFIKREKEES